MASQKITEIRFLLRIRGALTAAPRMDEPVMKMPQAAPTTHSANAKAIPTLAKAKGSTLFSTSCQLLLCK